MGEGKGGRGGGGQGGGGVSFVMGGSYREGLWGVGGGCPFVAGEDGA